MTQLPDETVFHVLFNYCYIVHVNAVFSPPYLTVLTPDYFCVTCWHCHVTYDTTSLIKPSSYSGIVEQCLILTYLRSSCCSPVALWDNAVSVGSILQHKRISGYFSPQCIMNIKNLDILLLWCTASPTSVIVEE